MRNSYYQLIIHTIRIEAQQMCECSTSHGLGLGGSGVSVKPNVPRIDDGTCQVVNIDYRCLL